MSDWTQHLTQGERVIWEGAPDTRLFVLRGHDGFLIPFAVFFAVISIGVVILGALTDPVFLGVGLIFSVATLYIGLGRFFVGQARRKRTRYALTTGRALIAEGSNPPKGMALTPDLPITHRRDRVTFGRPVPAFTNRSSAAAMAGGDADFTFVGLPDAKAVRDLADQTRTGNAP